MQLIMAELSLALTIYLAATCIELSKQEKNGGAQEFRRELVICIGRDKERVRE